MNILWPAHLARSEPFLYSFSSTCKVCSVPCCNLFSPPTSRFMKPLSADITYIIKFLWELQFLYCHVQIVHAYH